MFLRGSGDHLDEMDNFGQLVTTVARLWRRSANERLDRYGISHAAAMPLLALWQLGGKARQGAVAEQAGLEGPSVVRLIDLLVAEGLMDRREDPTDRRAKILVLTAKGRERMQEINAVLAELRGEIIAEFDHQDLRTAAAVLKRLQSSLAAPPAA